MQKIILSVIVLFYSFWMFPTNSKAQIEDGIYSLSYQVNKAGDISASIANDYFVKPAKLFVDNGKMRVQLTIKQSNWVTEFTSPHGGNKKVSEDLKADTRLVEFAITGINSPTVIKMKVDIDEMNYHHTYSTDFVWDAASLKLLEAAKKPEPVKEEPKAVEKAPEPKVEEVKIEPAKSAVQTSVSVPAKVEEKPEATPVKMETKAETKVVEEPKKEEARLVEAKQGTTTEKATEQPAAEEKVAEPATKEAKEAVKEEQKTEQQVAVATAEEKEEEQKETVTLTEETETAAAPAEVKSTSSAWIYIVIAVILAGLGAVFLRKRSAKKAV
ncbi:MAG: NEAT domain-containing protein [Solibacillus sp.]